MAINTMKSVDAMADTPIIAAEDNVVRNAMEIGEMADVVGSTVI